VTGGGAALLGLPRTDKVAELDGVAIVTFRDGKLTSLTEYWDAASAMRQLGADIHQPRFPSPAAQA
jgi:ketosteroid isomerase-like protein